MIYLDNAATTRISDSVLEAMLPYLKEQYGNPGSSHTFGRTARSAVKAAREQVSRAFGVCGPENIIFTSGGTESNNLVFHGVKERLLQQGKRHIIVSAIEHDSVLRAAESLTKEGFYISKIAPDADGTIHPPAVFEAIRPDTGLVSVMYVNNETGAINVIEDIGRGCHQRGALFHTDCVQAMHLLPLQVERGNVDFASISSHKLHGPKGVGALYVSDRSLISPMIHGGSSQEYGLRGGTENVAGIVGFGMACKLFFYYPNRPYPGFKRPFYEALCKQLEERGHDPARILKVNGCPAKMSGSILNLCINGVDGQTLQYMLDIYDVCISTGSACNSNETTPSHVLKAMGLSDEEARSSVRVSFSRLNTKDDVEQAADRMATCIHILRAKGR